jgi:hypothetical protein
LMLTALIRALLVSQYQSQKEGIAKSTLKAKCSKKCAVPFVRSVSARLPASIQTPTVDV